MRAKTQASAHPRTTEALLGGTLPIMSTDVLRYETISGVSSALDPVDDALDWIAGLRSTQYTSDLLRKKHGFVSSQDVRSAAATVAAHTAAAAGLIEQARSGPTALSFLPLYYAILSLSKICVAIGPQRAFIGVHRHHGASYNPLQKSSRDLRTETITLQPKGVLGLFYTTLTGEPWYRAARAMHMAAVMPFITSVGFEHNLAFGSPPKLARVHVGIEGDAGSRYQLTVAAPLQPPIWNGRLRELRAFRGLKQDSKDSNEYRSPSVTANSASEARRQLIGRHLRPSLLYDPHEGNFVGSVGCLTPVCSRHLLLPEELPIWLTFFHMSNIVRYKPEFLAKLSDSRSWPFLLAIRRHGLLRFLLLFLSFMHKTAFHLSAR